MSKVKKIIAVVLATLMLMSVGVFSSSAATTAPEFKVTLVSETATTVVVRFSLVKGAFNSLDFKFYTSSALTSCTKIEQTSEFSTQGCLVTLNPATKMVAVAGINTIKKATSIVDATFTKKTSAPVRNTDIAVIIESCAVISDGTSAGNQNVDITDQTKVTVSLNHFTLNETSKAMNYKSSSAISYETNYAKADLTWTSSNEKVATVDDEGKVYAAGTGSATINVTSADGTVNENIEITVSYQWWEWIIIIVLFGWIWY